MKVLIEGSPNTRKFWCTKCGSYLEYEESDKQFTYPGSKKFYTITCPVCGNATLEVDPSITSFFDTIS